MKSSCRSATALHEWELLSKYRPIRRRSSRFKHQPKKPSLQSRMTKMPGPFYRSAAAVLLFIAAPVVLVYTFGRAGLRFNATPSVPFGLYWISSDPAAEFVEFCPPEPFGTLSVERG